MEQMTPAVKARMERKREYHNMIDNIGRLRQALYHERNSAERRGRLQTVVLFLIWCSQGLLLYFYGSLR